MRPLHAALGVALVVAMAAAVAAGGRAVSGGSSLDAVGQTASDTTGGLDQAAASGTLEAEPTATGPAPAIRSRRIDPEIIAPPSLNGGDLERVEPRAPLSKLALAQPPKPKMPDDWKGTTLFQPVAPAAGLIEAKGYTVAVSGIDIVPADEKCQSGGKDWACGLRARTAFRAFLRGRAVICAVPPEGGRDTIAAACRVGKRDIGAWLVENGWARSLKGGPYAAAGDMARKAGKGIFGAAPDLSGLPPPPPAVEETVPEAPSSILDLSGTAATPPDIDLSTPQVFPPAPVR